jgi:hypothetical protein
MSDQMGWPGPPDLPIWEDLAVAEAEDNVQATEEQSQTFLLFNPFEQAKQVSFLGWCFGFVF